MKDKALAVDGKVDDIRRLHRNPPVEWDGRTAWSIHNGPGGLALLESAVIECPDCGERGYWRAGHLRCESCGLKRLIG